MIMKSPGHCLDFVTASSLLNLLQCISGSRFCSAPRKGHISFSSPKLASRLRFHVTLEQGRFYIVSHFKDFLPVPMPHSRTLSSCLFIHRSCAVVLLVRCSRKWLYPLRSKTLSCSNSKASVISSAWVLFPLRGSSAFWYQMSCQYFQLNTSLVKLLIRLSVRLCPPDCANGTRMSHINFFACTRFPIPQLTAKSSNAHINRIHRLHFHICLNYLMLMKLDSNGRSAFQSVCLALHSYPTAHHTSHTSGKQSDTKASLWSSLPTKP